MVLISQKNPFQNNVVLDARAKAKVVMMSCVIAPLRLIGITIASALAYMLAVAILYDHSRDEPLRGWRRHGKQVVMYLMILVHMIAGFFRYKIRGKQAEPWEAPILVLASHATFFDILPIMLLGAPSPVGKVELMDVPILGTLLALASPILVKRDCPDSRQATREMIAKRAGLLTKDAGDEGWSQVLMFPEGTCTNSSSLITFKPGAFYPGLPVQPVCLKWPNDPDWVSWTWEGTPGLMLFWLTLCRFESRFEMEFLPIYVPNEEEKKNAFLFAANVRQKIADHMKLPVSDYSAEDAVFVTTTCAVKRKRFWNICAKLGIDNPGEVGNNLSELFSAWRELQRSQWKSTGYTLDINQFCQFLNVKDTEPVHRLFQMFNWRCTGRIDVREFIICKYCDVDHPAFLPLVLQMFSKNGRKSALAGPDSETISEDDVISSLRFPYQMSIQEIRSVYVAVKLQYTAVTVESLLNYLRQSKQYRSIAPFATITELSQTTALLNQVSCSVGNQSDCEENEDGEDQTSPLTNHHRLSSSAHRLDPNLDIKSVRYNNNDKANNGDNVNGDDDNNTNNSFGIVNSSNLLLGSQDGLYSTRPMAGGDTGEETGGRRQRQPKSPCEVRVR